MLTKNNCPYRCRALLYMTNEGRISGIKKGSRINLEGGAEGVGASARGER